MKVILEMIALTRKQLSARKVRVSKCFSMDPNPFVFCQIFGMRDGPPPTIQTRVLPRRLQVRPSWLPRRVLRKNAFGRPVRYATIRELRKVRFPESFEGCRFLRATIEGGQENDAILFLWREVRK